MGYYARLKAAVVSNRISAQEAESLWRKFNLYHQNVTGTPVAQRARLSAGAVARQQRLRQMTGGGGRRPRPLPERPPGFAGDEEREARNFWRRAQKQKIGSKEQVEATAKWREDRRQRRFAAEQDWGARRQRDTITRTVGEGVSPLDIEEDLARADFWDLNDESPRRMEPIAPGTKLAKGADREAANKRLRELEMRRRNQNLAARRRPDKVVKTDIDLPGGRARKETWQIPLKEPTIVAAEKVHIRVPKGYSKEYANKFAMRELLKEKRKAQWRARARQRKRLRRLRLFQRGLVRHPYV